MTPPTSGERNKMERCEKCNFWNKKQSTFFGVCNLLSDNRLGNKLYLTIFFF